MNSIFTPTENLVFDLAHHLIQQADKESTQNPYRLESGHMNVDAIADKLSKHLTIDLLSEHYYRDRPNSSEMNMIAARLLKIGEPELHSLITATLNKIV